MNKIYSTALLGNGTSHVVYITHDVRTSMQYIGYCSVNLLLSDGSKEYNRVMWYGTPFEKGYSHALTRQERPDWLTMEVLSYHISPVSAETERNRLIKERGAIADPEYYNQRKPTLKAHLDTKTAKPIKIKSWENPKKKPKTPPHINPRTGKTQYWKLAPCQK